MINIFYLLHSRIDGWKILSHFLNKIKKDNKKNIKLYILSSFSNNDFIYEIPLIDINHELLVFNGELNYMNKINFAINQDSEYSIKLDEDCFINNHIFDFIIENRDILDNDKNLLVSPIINNNIPTCDIFIDEYIEDDTVKNSIYNYFLKREMPNGLWGVNYEPLNEHTIHSKKWDYMSFYDGVEKIPTIYKGIHPLRISYESQVIVNDYILNNIEKLVNKNGYSFFEMERPYFTNSVFMIKTQKWKEIVNQNINDGYDEVKLNLYKRANELNFVFIKNGFGIHTMYNTVFGNKNRWNIGGENGYDEEIKFTRNYYNKIIEHDNTCNRG